MRKTENAMVSTVPREEYPDEYVRQAREPIDPFPDAGPDPAPVFSDPNPNPVVRPAHYTSGRIEPIDAIEDWDLGFHLGNAVKYIARSGRKGDRREDLRKAAWYILRELWRTSERQALVARAMAILGEEV